MPKVAKETSMTRQWELLKLLPTKPPYKAASQLHQELQRLGFNVTKRTVERDLLELSDDFPILCHDKSKPFGWYWNPERSADLPAITLAEALSLRLVEESLKPLLPTAVYAGLNACFKQAHYKLSHLQKSNPMAAWQDKVRFVPPTLPLIAPKLNAEALDIVQQALLEDKQLKISYQAASKKTSTQILHPLALVQRPPVTYLVATAFAYQDILLYALHRIKRAELLQKPANRPADFKIDAYIAAGHLQFGEGLLHLQAWIGEELMNHLAETALSKDQTLTPADQGGYLLTATVINSWQLRWWILSQGDGIVVLEPTGLRQEILATLRLAVNGYQERNQQPHGFLIKN